MVCRQSLCVGPNAWLLQLLTSASHAVAAGKAGFVASTAIVTVAGSVPDAFCSCAFTGGVGSGQAFMSAEWPH